MVVIVAIALIVLTLLWMESFLVSPIVPRVPLFSSFEKEWPAISDDEFVRRCPPGTRREVALKVRAIVSERLGLPYEHIYPGQNFVEDLGCG